MSKVAIVTGGRSGIGLATATKLHANDYRVIVADRSFGGAGAIIPLLIDEIPCDVGSAEQVKSLFQYCRNRFGRLDVLVNCAGVHYSSEVHEDGLDRYRRLMETNVDGVYYCCHEALQLMEEGVIVNVASSVGIAADPAAAAYSASKAWVIHFTKCLAQGYGRRVRCNTICPGPTDTPLLRNAFGNDPAKLEEIAKMNPRGRIAMPEEIAEVILFMAGNKALFVNGATWEVDGGESIFYYEPPK